VRLARSICDVLTCAGSGLLAADVIKTEGSKGEYRVAEGAHRPEMARAEYWP
jgi:hypothetical protein